MFFKERRSPVSGVRRLPLLPLRELVVFPHAAVPFMVGRARSVTALTEANASLDKEIFLVAQREALASEPGVADVHTVGTIATVVQVIRLPDGKLKVLVDGQRRGRMIRFHDEEDCIRAEVEESLRRLETDRLDLLYLHAPDPAVPIEDSAGELARLLAAGKTRAVGVSNVSLAQLTAFAAACPLAACQMHFNMLQREIEREILPWCRGHNVAMVVYWPLMKGLLAGGMRRDTQFPTSDSRHKYPMFNGDEFQRNLDFVDVLRPVAARLGCSLPDLVLAWTAEQPGITSVLFGATSPEQARINSRALACDLDDDARRDIAAAITTRGPVASRRAV